MAFRGILNEGQKSCNTLCKEEGKIDVGRVKGILHCYLDLDLTVKCRNRETHSLGAEEGLGPGQGSKLKTQ